MTDVHPTAILEGQVELAEDVSVGPYCVLDATLGPIELGRGTRLYANVYLYGPLSLGAANVLYPGACLGFAPQSLEYDPARAGRGLVVGDHNTFRETVTIHRAMTEEGPTRVGSHNYFMACSHAGHDSRIGDHCVLANGAAVGGHAVIEDRVMAGGHATVHQFCRIGRGAALSGSVGTGRDVPPYFTLTGINICGSVNLVGMRRQGMSRDEIEDVRWAFRILCRGGLPRSQALSALAERAERPIVAEYISFVEATRKGICTAWAQRGRARDFVSARVEMRVSSASS